MNGNMFTRRFNKMVDAYEAETGQKVDKRLVINRRTAAADIKVAALTFVLGWLLLSGSIYVIGSIALEGVTLLKIVLLPFALFETVTFFIAIIPTAGFSGLIRAAYLYRKMRRYKQKLTPGDWLTLVAVNCDGGWAILPFISIAMESPQLRDVITWRAKKLLRR